MAKTGVYLIGACGNVGVTTIVGALAISRGLSDSTGLVTEGPEFRGLQLPLLNDLVLGGCDVVRTPLKQRAAEVGEARIFPAKLVEPLKAQLDEVDARIARIEGFAFGTLPKGGYLAELARIEERLARFRSENGLERLIVVNVSSTEPHFAETPEFDTPQALMAALGKASAGFCTNTFLNALAALRQGCAFINFTPSQASELPALRKIARDTRLPHAGKDGKTGETLLKTVLGPMFIARNLRVMSWVGNNFLGNSDGQTLDAPAAKDSKIRQKDVALREMLGGDAHVQTDIKYVPSLGDWKTAWDLVHFKGFLGTEMTLSFTWQGCDSALAAPLVLDLVRLVDAAWRNGESGLLPQLSPFFKNPLDGHTHDFARQMANLYAWADQLRGARAGARR